MYPLSGRWEFFLGFKPRTVLGFWGLNTPKHPGLPRQPTGVLSGTYIGPVENASGDLVENKVRVSLPGIDFTRKNLA